MKNVLKLKNLLACGEYLRDVEGTLTNPTTKPFNESNYYCKWKLQPPEDIENKDWKKRTLSIEVTGLIGKSKGTTVCRSFLNYISMKGNLKFLYSENLTEKFNINFITGSELLAKICGNLTKDSITVASPYEINYIEVS